MTDSLFDIPASEPPLEVELHHAREQLAIAESALADAEDNSDDGGEALRAQCCRLARYLATLEAKMLAKLKQ